MSKFSKLRPSPALVVALAALVAAMSGAAIALPGKNSVKKNDIANGAVTGKKIAEGAVKSKQIKGKSIKGNRLKDKTIKSKQIADDAITSAQVAENGLNSTDIADHKAASVKATATDHADENVGRADSPVVPLLTVGQISFEAKCFRDENTDTLYAEVYAKTSVNGAILHSPGDTLAGGATADFLNTDTPLLERQLHAENVGPDTADYDDRTFVVTGADGRQLIGQVSIALKNGTLAGGNGPYGPGNVCLLGLQVSG
jgi:hypothetical protein